MFSSQSLSSTKTCLLYSLAKDPNPYLTTWECSIVQSQFGKTWNSADKRKGLQQQDWLQTMIERDDQRANARIIGSMVDFCEVEPGRHAHLQKALVNPDITFVSLTLTEGGYFLDASTGNFDPSKPDVVHDGKNPHAPTSVFGLILSKPYEDAEMQGFNHFPSCRVTMSHAMEKFPDRP